MRFTLLRVAVDEYLLFLADLAVTVGDPDVIAIGILIIGDEDFGGGLNGGVVPKFKGEGASGDIERQAQRLAGRGARVGSDNGFQRPASGVDITLAGGLFLA